MDARRPFCKWHRTKLIQYTHSNFVGRECKIEITLAFFIHENVNNISNVLENKHYNSSNRTRYTAVNSNIWDLMTDEKPLGRDHVNHISTQIARWIENLIKARFSLNRVQSLQHTLSVVPHRGKYQWVKRVSATLAAKLYQLLSNL